MRELLKTIYKGLVVAESWVRHPFLLVVRLYWGAQLVMIGFGKWMHIGGVSTYFESLGLSHPYFQASLVATMELLGGISLFTGLLSRLFTIPLIIIFGVAYSTAHIEAVHHLFSNPSLFLHQEPFLFLYAALLVFCFGPGLFSFDAWLEKRWFGRTL